jgi:hypothetical protein
MSSNSKLTEQARAVSGLRSFAQAFDENIEKAEPLRSPQPILPKLLPPKENGPQSGGRFLKRNSVSVRVEILAPEARFRDWGLSRRPFDDEFNDSRFTGPFLTNELSVIFAGGRPARPLLGL